LENVNRIDIYRKNITVSLKVANGNDIKKSGTFLPYWTFWLDMEKLAKKTNEQANLAHSTCIF
jgi:hypothetical protein